ncbi:MAG TPA: NAD(P)H-dependent glycerol-3-phosphate dehydrogenase [Acidimicrobiia bacterium]|jgi:glycerol-3-phosphate dehydrogenase (NAD(P)+)
MHVTVVGAGSWGTAVAAMVSARAPVTLWARRRDLADAINTERRNPAYLPDLALPDPIAATDSLEEAVAQADVLVLGVPSHGMREVLSSAAAGVRSDVPIISLAKGIEHGTLMRMTEVISDVLPEHPVETIGVLTGPNLAREIVEGQPAASVIAMEAEGVAHELRGLFMSPTFRVYTNTDVIGSESAGAVKNVMAIAAGMAHGLGFGDNSTATLITRALAELTRLGVAMGGRPITFSGLAGMGDLIATCVSTRSRNHQVGFGLGMGRSLDEVTAEMKMVAEGVKSTEGVLALAARHGVEMPIAEQVGRVLYEGATPTEALTSLMAREARSEHEGIPGV